MDISCPSCNNKQKLVLVGNIHPAYQFAGKVLQSPIRGNILYRCKSCHLCYRWPQPSKAQMDVLYQVDNADSWQYNPEDRKDWQIAANWLNEQVVGKTVLDIGCFDGGFGEYLGWSWDRYGVEINEPAVKRTEKRGIRIISRDFSEMDNFPIKFDAVTAFDVIEHV